MSGHEPVKVFSIVNFNPVAVSVMMWELLSTAHPGSIVTDLLNCVLVSTRDKYSLAVCCWSVLLPADCVRTCKEGLGSRRCENLSTPGIYLHCNTTG